MAFQGNNLKNANGRLHSLIRNRGPRVFSFVLGWKTKGIERKERS